MHKNTLILMALRSHVQKSGSFDCLESRRTCFPMFCDMTVCQNLVPLVNVKIAGTWMFIPLKMVLIGIDPYPYHRQTTSTCKICRRCIYVKYWPSVTLPSLPRSAKRLLGEAAWFTSGTSRLSERFGRDDFTNKNTGCS